MAKKKSFKKAGMSDKVRTKKSSGAGKMNPFEVKINKQKHQVIGKKVAKHDRGMPGVSRSKAVKKRKETLLVEYQKRGKSNKFVDRRFGETDPEMSLEDKMLQRFAMERQKTHEKPGTFNLNDEEELTHYGQSLSEIEKFDDPDVSDDEGGKLDGDLVTEEHFGGFLTRKRTPTGDEDQQKSWKERMEEIITKSKKEKHERQSEREKTTELTEQMDQEWKTIMGSIVTSKRNKDIDTPEPVQKADDYDIMVRELQFDIRGKATDRLKTEEEIAKEEKEKLDKLEADRLRRMKGVTEEDHEAQRVVFRSADDLDDGFSYNNKQVKYEVSYKDGKLSNYGTDSEDKKGAEEADSDEEDDKDSDEEDSDEEENEDGDSSSSEEDVMGGGSDLESSEDDSQDEDSSGEEAEPVNVLTKPTKQEAPKGILKNRKMTKEPLTEEQQKEKFKKMKTVMETAKKELPYSFPAPETYADLLQLLEGHSDKNQFVIIERLQKLYHPSLAEGNKTKLQTLHELLLQYYSDLALQDPPLLGLMDRLVKPLYQLTVQFPIPAATIWMQFIRERQQDFSEVANRRGGKGIYPSLDVLMMMKLAAVLFPTSDFRHPVITPAMLFMGQVLSQCPVASPIDVASGLFLNSLFLQYVSFSKRLVPEAVNFLVGLLFTSIPKSPEKIEKVPPPFKPVGKNVDILKLETPCLSYKPEPLKIGKVFSSEGTEFLQSDHFKVCAVHQSLGLLQKYHDLYKSLPSCPELFQPALYYMEKLNMKDYPAETKNLYEEVKLKLESMLENPRKQSLQRPKERPKPLKLFEPKFEEVYDGKKKFGGTRDYQEKQRLVHKLKRETKGAIRSLRQDNQFLARQKLNDQMSRDSERKRKVKELMADLASQEGDFKALKRMKDKLT